MQLEWDENKRRSNLLKHGLDFAKATEILASRYRMDRQLVRGEELRTQSFSYVMGYLAVLTVVHLERGHAVGGRAGLPAEPAFCGPALSTWTRR
jgi:uncharacterized DUF497 family protein